MQSLPGEAPRPPRAKVVVPLRAPLLAVRWSLRETVTTAAKATLPLVSPAAEATAAADAARTELMAQRLTQVVDQLTQDLHDAREHRRQLLGEMQQFAVELACCLATKVVRHLVETSDTTVTKVADEIFAQLEHAAEIRFFTHPQDVKSLTQHLHALTKQLASEIQIQVLPEPGLPRGDVVAESNVGDLAALLDLQLMDLRYELLENLDAAEIERRRLENQGRAIRRYPDRRQTA